MSDRKVHFDWTINLGHVLTGGTFLVAIALAWANLDGRTTQNAKDIDRSERAAERNDAKIETVLMSRITDVQASLNQTQVRTADDLREIKGLIRSIDDKLDRKQDKPGR